MRIITIVAFARFADTLNMPLRRCLRPKIEPDRIMRMITRIYDSGRSDIAGATVSCVVSGPKAPIAKDGGGIFNRCMVEQMRRPVPAMGIDRAGELALPTRNMCADESLA